MADNPPGGSLPSCCTDSLPRKQGVLCCMSRARSVQQWADPVRTPTTMHLHNIPTLDT